MLRYKNSLLERILLEKGSLPSLRVVLSVAYNATGIDVQAELKSKTEGSHVMPHPPHQGGLPQPSPVQKALLNRHNHSTGRRSTSGSGSQALRPRSSQTSSTMSPRLQPTRPSQNLSPTSTKAPIGLGKGGIMSPSVDLKAQQQQQPPPPHEPHAYSQQAPSRMSIPATRPTIQTMTPSTADGSRSSEMGSAAGTAHSNFYPSPFQAHIEQLGKLSRPLLSVFLYRAMFVLD